jgi:hypothetical protein
MDSEDKTLEVTVESIAPKKRGKPRKVEADPNLPFTEYRKLYQKEYYTLHPRTPKPKPPREKKRTEEETRQMNLEYAKRYYIKHKERIIQQILEARNRKKIPLV